MSRSRATRCSTSPPSLRRSPWRTLLRLAQALPERRFLLGVDLQALRDARRDVPRPVRDRPDQRLDRPWLEMIDDKEQKIDRPRRSTPAAAQLEYVRIEQRYLTRAAGSGPGVPALPRRRTDRFRRRRRAVVERCCGAVQQKSRTPPRASVTSGRHPAESGRPDQLQRPAPQRL